MDADKNGTLNRQGRQGNTGIEPPSRREKQAIVESRFTNHDSRLPGTAKIAKGSRKKAGEKKVRA
jgi:hypothetical protein